MNALHSRRSFLADVGGGTLLASLGISVAGTLGLAGSDAVPEEPAPLHFGALEPLVRLLQECPTDQLLPAVTQRLRAGTDLKTWVAAAALANARTFGGEDYVGYHTLMALAPAYHMALEEPIETRALPVLKVLYRNTQRIHEHGGRSSEVLHGVRGVALPVGESPGPALQAAVRRRDLPGAEQLFATLAQGPAEDAFNHLLFAVQDHAEVHRVVLPYRAWDLVGIIGRDQAHTLLRQSVRYCVQAESWAQTPSRDEPRTLLPRLLDQHALVDRSTGSREVDDAWVDSFANTLFRASPVQAAETAAAALAEGIHPDAIGEAITLAANQLVLRDAGRTAREEQHGKPIGSVHGDSIGVHAMDSANAWRNMARVGTPRNVFACLILGAYQVARDRIARGGDFLQWQPLPLERHLEQAQSVPPENLVRELHEAIRANLQARASALVHRYGTLGLPHREVFNLLRAYATTEDGSLHAEKFYRTVSEEFASTRSAFRWRHVVALARVTASEYGRRAAGIEEARKLLAAT